MNIWIYNMLLFLHNLIDLLLSEESTQIGRGKGAGMTGREEVQTQTEWKVLYTLLGKMAKY